MNDLPEAHVSNSNSTMDLSSAAEPTKMFCHYAVAAGIEDIGCVAYAWSGDDVWIHFRSWIRNR